MKKTFWLLMVGVLILCLSLPSFANLNHFQGKWKNVNIHTRGLTALKIRVTGARVTVHAYGKCHPTDCDWGLVKGLAYGPNVSSNVIHSANRISAMFNTGHSRIIVIIKPAGGNRITAEAMTHFTDNSGRNDYWNTYKLRRVSETGPSGPIHPGQPPQPVQPIHPGQLQVREDCISFSPVRAQVRNVGGRWKIVDGSRWMFDFDHKENEARKALRIIKKYRFRFSCFVGRPDPSFTYLKR